MNLSTNSQGLFSSYNNSVRELTTKKLARNFFRRCLRGIYNVISGGNRITKVHEMRLSERDAREEEHALLSRALNKFKKSKQKDSQTLRGRERGRRKSPSNDEKNKKDQENRLINQRFDVITINNSVILQMNAKMRRNREYVKNRRI